MAVLEQSKEKQNFRNYICRQRNYMSCVIVNMESLFITPHQDFWEKTEFFSELKQSAVNDEDYERSKYLYQTLKMRNLGDLNDLYNV